jgi:hypothetical protein
VSRARSDMLPVHNGQSILAGQASPNVGHHVGPFVQGVLGASAVKSRVEGLLLPQERRLYLGGLQGGLAELDAARVVLAGGGEEDGGWAGLKAALHGACATLAPAAPALWRHPKV